MMVIKRRLKRLVLALMGRARPTVAGGEAACARLVEGLYQLLLLREPDPESAQAFKNALLDGMDVVSLVGAIVASPEFGAAALRQATVAEPITRAVIETLMGRPIEPEAIAAYAGSLRAARPLEDLIVEMLNSAEFRARFGAAVGSSAASPGEGDTPIEIAALAESLLVEQLRREGVRPFGPPLDDTRRRSIPAAQMRALLHALALSRAA